MADYATEQNFELAKKMLGRQQGEINRLTAAIDDTLWRMYQLRSWAYRDLNEEGLKNVIAVIANVLDILDPDRTRGAALDTPTAAVLPKHEKRLRAERDALNAAVADVRRLCEMTIATSCRAQAIDQAVDTLAVLDRALDTPTAPETTPDAPTGGED